MKNNQTDYYYATPQFAESYTDSDESFDYFEEVDLDSIEFEAFELSEMDALRIEIDDELEQTLQEMEELKKDLEEGQAGKLADAIKENVMSTIKGQFGIASLLIESKDGGSVTTAHNFEKGITATESDAKRYDGWQEAPKKYHEHKKDEFGNFVLNDKGKKIKAGTRVNEYNPKHTDMRKEYIKDNGHLVDDKYNPGHKISTEQQYTYDEAGKKHIDAYSSAELDHVVPITEVEFNSEAHFVMTQEERVNVVCSDENYAFTSRTVNGTGGKVDKPMKEFLESDAGKKLIAEGKIDTKAAMQADEQARKHIKKEVNVAKAKKYRKELVTTGAKDSLKTGVYAMFGPLLKDVAVAVFDELKVAIALRKEGKKWKEVLKHFKERMKIVIEDIKTKVKAEFSKMAGDGVWAAITAFLSNIVVWVINCFATTLKKIVSIIRAGFASIVQAIRTVTTNPQKLSDEDKWFEAGKILATGVIGAVSLGLSAALETLITSIIPFLVPISDIVSTVISAIIGGIVSSILVYYMDKAHARNQKDKLQIQLVNRSGQVVQLKVVQAWFAVSDANLSVQKTANTLLEAKYHAVNMVTDSINIQAELDAYIDETDKYVEELFNF